MPRSALAKFAEHKRITQEKVQKRLQHPTAKPDILSYLLASKHDLTEAKIVTNANTLIVAGSHTLQTGVTGIVFHLLHNQEALTRVTHELREAFASETDIDTKSLMQLPLLGAAVKEGMRLTSPVPLGLTRRVPDGGAVICGSYFPSGTVVSYMQWAANLSGSNYTDPTRFALERWLDSDTEAGSRYKNDRKEASQPFLQGPRDCIGQNLARSEIFLMIGHLLYNFGLSLPEGSGSHLALNNWEDQEI